MRLEELGNVIDGVENDKVSRLVQRRRAASSWRSSGSPAPTRWRWSTASWRCCRSSAARFRRPCNLDVAFDASQSIRGSIRDVEFTLVLTICLVVMVIFLFLRNLSATLIPGLRRAVLDHRHVRRDVPARLQPEQSLADGADAVGGLRRGRRHRHAGEHRAPHGDGRDAAWRPRCIASREIGFTIISMTISLVAVFIPVLFMGGIVGRLLHEFSVTIVVAILISGFVSLTLTPMLGSRFLQHEPHAPSMASCTDVLECGFDAA